MVRLSSKKSRSDLPEVLISSAKTTRFVSREVRAGRLRKLGSRVYSSNLHDSPHLIVRRNLWFLVSQLYPKAIIADRTAIENSPAADGSVFIISNKKHPLVLPGVTIRPRKGLRALKSDRDFIGGLKLASPARAYLENLKLSRARKGSVSRTLTRLELEDHLEETLQARGEAELNKIRDQARQIAKPLGLTKELKIFDFLVGVLLGTKQIKTSSERVRARVRGEPFDTRRLELFTELRNELERTAPIIRMARRAIGETRTVLPFFESYFSNFIEGTEFEVEEAEKIIFKGLIPRKRPQDAHDILGTFKVVSDEKLIAQRSKDPDQFIERLKHVHSLIMSSRADKRPGVFKHLVNRAGSTDFVAAELVIGTLRRGFEIASSISTPFGRAVFVMFLVSEVHPFLDGNGRTARACMNTELVSEGETRIVIPTIYRNDYMGALKGVTHNRRFTVLIKVLDFAQRYTAAVDWSSIASAREVLQKTNAFYDSVLAEQQGVYLMVPGAGR